jgi:hypothetical protein
VFDKALATGVIVNDPLAGSASNLRVPMKFSPGWLKAPSKLESVPQAAKNIVIPKITAISVANFRNPWVFIISLSPFLITYNFLIRCSLS